jgi:hypothetical protein
MLIVLIGCLGVTFLGVARAFSASLIKAKFLGNFSADSLRSHSVLKANRLGPAAAREYLLILGANEVAGALIQEVAEAARAEGVTALRQEPRNEIVSAGVLTLAEAAN